MNRLIILFLSVSTLFCSCNTDIDYPFQGKDKVHFKHYNISGSGSRVYFNKTVVPSGIRPDEIEIDTARVVVELLGRKADYDRKYNVIVLADSTDAVEGVHYKPLKGEYILKANQLTDTMEVYVIRKNLSTSFRNPEDKRLCLEIQPSEEFDCGLQLGLNTSLILNNYLPEPVWWESKFMGGLYYYHPKKWKILMSFDEKFADFNSVPYDFNSSGGKAYMRGLDYYLESNVVVDDETGERLKMKEMLPPTL